MSEKSLDPQGRMRSKTIAFRMSPEEADLLQRYADMSGMTKQDYLISRVLQRDVTVIPRKRMQLYMEENMLFVFKNKVKLLPSGIQGKNAAILGASALIWQEAADFPIRQM